MIHKFEEVFNEKRIYIFGAKSIAIGICRAIRKINPSTDILGFIVSNLANNPRRLEGLDVNELATLSEELSPSNKREICVYIATPEDVHESIINCLNEYGFTNIKAIDATTESRVMGLYYKELGLFPGIESFQKKYATDHTGQTNKILLGGMPQISIYSAGFYLDKKLNNPPIYDPYVHTVFLGCKNAREKGIILDGKAEFYDDTGDNISYKNSNYCEMTAYYWIWKNRLKPEDEYIGVYHYRRSLDISKENLCLIKSNNVDAVLPYPLIHVPNIKEHHTRYVKESDYNAMLKALKELYPNYFEAYESIFSTQYFYNYNLIIAKKEVFEEYCKWVFPILERTEELAIPKQFKRADRYLAYMSESLFTLYFLYHRELKILHTGRIMYT